LETEVVQAVVANRDDRHRLALVIEATDGRVLEVHDLGDLLGHGREHLGGRGAFRHERRHAT
jgi:hypothetical protein